MAENKINWTKEQLLAIKQRDKDVLVTASAGTGKTAVLSGRCVDIISDKTACPDIFGMLVLTFTNAAADQMRSRIAEQMQNVLNAEKTPEIHKHLKQQILLLPAADISTIHSFCKKLITQHFYQLGIDPTFKVIESDEQQLLKSQVLEQTIDWAWEQPDISQVLPGIFEMTDLKADGGVLSRIVEINDYLDGIVGRENWYKNAAEIAENLNPFGTNLGDKQKQILIKKMSDILERIRFALSVYRKENPKGSWADKWEINPIGDIEKCIELARSGDWNECAQKIINFGKPKTFVPNDISETAAKIAKDNLKRAMDDFEKLTNLAIINPDYLSLVTKDCAVQTKTVIRLVEKFNELYSQAKAASNCMDFADLELNALKILSQNHSPEQGVIPSEIALSLRQKYKYIFVDEYQDINRVQKAILDLLSSGGNIFVVGDIKQSIYAFRGAEPKIFLDNLSSASPDSKNAPNGLRVDLNANYRSDKQILDFVNKIFGRVMTSSFGDIDYDESAKLKSGIEQKIKERPAVEFIILDEQQDSKEPENENEKIEADEKHRTIDSTFQAALIAQKIKEMVGDSGKPALQIFDKKLNTTRDVYFGDIVVLMRSLSKKANDYVEIFQMAGIPVTCDAATGYFEKTEIRDIVSLLKVIDNPIRDIEIAALLRSPMFSLSDTELAMVRLHCDKQNQAKSFYDCLLEYQKSGAEKSLREKLIKIFNQLCQWRTIARRGEIADLIWEIYQQTNYIALVSALPNGKQRKANLLKLHKRAIQFGQFTISSGIPSLARFVEFIEKMQEAGREFGSPEPPAQSQAVRILSIHKSKGLEFPVVFLAELESRFNRKDVNQDFLADADCTLGLRVTCKSKTKIATLAHQVIAEQKFSSTLAEEMRILYVAMTRAKEKLILTACQDTSVCGNILSKGLFFGKTISDWQLRKCKNHLEWILFGLSDLKIMHEKFKTGLSQKASKMDLFDLEIIGYDELNRLCDYISDLKKKKSVRIKSIGRVQNTEPSKLFSNIKKSLNWQYEFKDCTVTAAKRSVTQLTHGKDEFTQFDFTSSLETKIDVSGKKGDSRQIGTAVHLIFANIDLISPVSEFSVDKLKQKLVAEGKISSEISEEISSKSIVQFFATEPGKQILSAKQVFREWPFTFAMPACRLNPDAKTNDEFVIIQGIIDLLAVTKDGLIIVDFKNGWAKNAADIHQSYRQQLNLYADAAQAILNLKVTSKWLYFLKSQAVFTV